ncbi:hypothetical protein [Escherichia coli]|nr:hypothetical protein [Escherichia coli]
MGKQTLLDTYLPGLVEVPVVWLVSRLMLAQALLVMPPFLNQVRL